MSGFDRLPEAAAEVFGEGVTATEAYGLLTVDVPAGAWVASLTTARDVLGCTFFDWLSAVDQPGTGFQVCAHVARLAAPAPGDYRLSGGGRPSGGGQVPSGGRPSEGDGPSQYDRPSEGDGFGDRTGGPASSGGGLASSGGGLASSGGGLGHLLVRTTVPHDAPALPTATGVYPGAAWHERETHEMFGVDFPGHPGLDRLLLPEEFEGHPLRKDFVLAARVAKAWPGAKEPGESHDGGPRRRQMLPPGVPDPNEWGPLKGQLPPAPARPARAGRPALGAAPGASSERPARRMRSAGQGSASQRAAASDTPQAEPPAPAGPSAPGDLPGRTAPARKRVPDAPWERPRDPEPREPAAPEPPSQEASKPEPGAPEPKAPGSAPQAPEPEAPKTPEPEAPRPEPEGSEPEAPDAAEPKAPEPEARNSEHPDAPPDGDAEGGPR